MSEAQIKENEDKIENNVDDSEPLSNDNEADENDVEEQEVTIVTFGDKTPEDNHEEPAPEWAKNLRKKQREDAKEIKRLNKQLKGKTEEETPLGARPTMELCDYDEEVYVKQLDEWNDKKRNADSKANDEKSKLETEEAAWNTRLGEYETAQNVFNEDDFKEAEDIVSHALNDGQKTLLIHALGASAANVVSALGADSDELETLAKIQDQTLFTMALAKLKADMKVRKTNKPKYPPETKVRGSASHDLGDTKLNNLQAEAERTGDFTEVFAHKRKLRKS